MIRRACAAAALLAALLPLAPGAQPADGAGLLQQCNSDADACIAYLKAAADRYRAEDADWFCPNNDGDPRELRRLYLEWAAENPRDLEKPVVEAVKAMLADAFACSD
jgi:hypothetical protein